MTRKKVQLAYIGCDSARKSTYKKRKKGILKKIEELSTLCGVEACAVICSRYESDPVVWPNRENAGRVVDRFRNLPEMDQKRKMVDHPSYLLQRVGKTDHQLKRLERDNREREVLLTMQACMSDPLDLVGLSLMDLSDLGWMIDRSLKAIEMRFEALHPNNNNNNNNDDKNNNNNNNDAGDDVAEAQQPAPVMMPQAGYFGLGPEVVGPGMEQLMGLGPTFWQMGQFYEVVPGGFDGASSSGGGAI